MMSFVCANFKKNLSVGRICHIRPKATFYLLSADIPTFDSVKSKISPIGKIKPSVNLYLSEFEVITKISRTES